MSDAVNDGAVNVNPMPVIAPEDLRQLQASGELFNGVLTEHIQSLLTDPTFRQRVIDIVNGNVNIPILNEGLESQLFGQAYDFAVMGILSALKSID